MQEPVPDIASYDESPYAELAGLLADYLEYAVVEGAGHAAISLYFGMDVRNSKLPVEWSSLARQVLRPFVIIM